MNHVTFRWMGPNDVEAVVEASELFDGPARSDWAQRFLDEPGDHLCLAYDDAGTPVGFVSGVETIHPDKGTEMFLYELAVDEAARRQGIGRSLVEALAERARELGCYAMWVGVEPDNDAALRTYAAAGATEREDFVMLTWQLQPERRTENRR